MHTLLPKISHNTNIRYLSHALLRRNNADYAHRHPYTCGKVDHCLCVCFQGKLYYPTFSFFHQIFLSSKTDSYFHSFHLLHSIACMVIPDFICSFPYWWISRMFLHFLLLATVSSGHAGVCSLCLQLCSSQLDTIGNDFYVTEHVCLIINVYYFKNRILDC